MPAGRRQPVSPQPTFNGPQLPQDDPKPAVAFLNLSRRTMRTRIPATLAATGSRPNRKSNRRRARTTYDTAGRLICILTDKKWQNGAPRGSHRQWIRGQSRYSDGGTCKCGHFALALSFPLPGSWRHFCRYLPNPIWISKPASLRAKWRCKHDCTIWSEDDTTMHDGGGTSIVGWCLLDLLLLLLLYVHFIPLFTCALFMATY